MSASAPLERAKRTYKLALPERWAREDHGTHETLTGPDDVPPVLGLDEPKRGEAQSSQEVAGPLEAGPRGIPGGAQPGGATPGGAHPGGAQAGGPLPGEGWPQGGGQPPRY